MADKFNIYTAIKEWCEDSRLDSQHRDILLLITNRMNASYWKGAVAVPISTVCKITRMDKRTFFKKRKELIEWGWLECESGGAKTQAAKYRVKDSLGVKMYQADRKSEDGLGVKTYQGLVLERTKLGVETYQGLGVKTYPYKEEKKEELKEGGFAASVGEAESSQNETLIPERAITLVENQESETMEELTPRPDTLVSKKEPLSKRVRTPKVYTPPPEIAEPLKVFLGYPGFKEAWQAFRTQHEEKRGKMSTKTKDLMFRDLLGWSRTPVEAVQILEYSIKGNYPLLYKPKSTARIEPGKALPTERLPGNIDYKSTFKKPS